MKTLLKFLFATAIVSLAATSCVETPPENPDETGFKITFAASENGTAKAFIGDTEVTRAEAGQIVTVRASANAGYRLASWSSTPATGFDNINATRTDFMMPEGDIVITATFAPNISSLTWGIDPLASGTITVKVDGETIENGVEVASGKTVEIEAQPTEGHQFDRWVADPVVAFGSAGANAATTTFTMPDAAVALTAVFSSRSYVLTFGANPIEGGQVVMGFMDGEGDGVIAINSGDEVPFGSMLGAVYEASPGYTFTGWSSDEIVLSAGDKTNPELICAMPNMAATLTANFASIPTCKITLSQPENGTLTGVVWFNSGGGSHRPVVSGEEIVITNVYDEIVLTATPNAGYVFTDWTKTPEDLTMIDLGSSTAGGSARFNLIDGAVTIGAIFEPKPVENDWVEIAGVKWAKYNVGAPGQFVASESDYGRYYQFNYSFGWASPTDVLPAGSPYYNYMSEPFGWGNNSANAKNDPFGKGPCPDGYTVPTKAQYEAMIAAGSWADETIGNVKCKRLSAGGAALYFPYGGSMTGLTVSEVSSIGLWGHYWTNDFANHPAGAWTGNTQGPPPVANAFTFSASSAPKVDGGSGMQRFRAHSIRCVKTE